jgi:hypothetical protein
MPAGDGLGAQIDRPTRPTSWAEHVKLLRCRRDVRTALPLQVSTDSHERSQLRSVTSGLAETVGLEERVEDVVAPIVAYAQVVAQQTFAAEPELLNQLA